MSIFTTKTESKHQYLVIRSRNQEKLSLLELEQNTIIHIGEQAQLELNIEAGAYEHNLHIFLTKGAKLEILEQENWSGNIHWSIDLIEPHSQVQYKTRLEVKDNSNNIIKINHQAAYTQSNIDSRYCIASQFKLIQHTIINISKGINSCQAKQSAEVLLLTDRPQIKIIPELRVATDNSDAGHGVAIYPIKERDIFYLMARGISQTKSIRILKEGFLEG
ncbi:MAG: SufD family Fe-S cluster assembly protein [Candidatus Paceibacterota bacterium]